MAARKNRVRRDVASSAALIVAALVMLAAGAREAAADPRDCRGNGRKAMRCAPAPNNQPPMISGTPATSVTVGQTYAFVPTASDPEGKPLSFSIANKPPWASFSTSTGRISGVPAASAAGEHAYITIEVSDGRLRAALPPFSIVVRAANQAPSITGTPPQAARVGQPYEFTPKAGDPDGDALGFTIANRPAWALFDPTNGRLSGTPGAGSVGTYASIVIRASDGSLASALPAFGIVVEQSSLGSATLSWVAPTLREDGTPLTNLAGYRIRYGTVPGNYANQVQIPNPGITTCLIENLPAGTYYFVATAYDSSGAESGFSGVVSKTIG